MAHPSWSEWLAQMEEIMEVFESVSGEEAPLIEADFDEPKPDGFPSYANLAFHDPLLTQEIKDHYQEWVKDPENRRKALKPIPTGRNMSFTAILDEIQEMHDKKSSDYGRAVDPYANVRASEDFGITGWLGAVIRANDKMRRLQKFAADKVLVNESVEDSLLDLAVYAIIALDLYRQETSPAWRMTWEN